MKLLIFSAYYEPEVAASLYLSTNLYEDMAESGINARLYVPLPTRGVTDEDRKKYRGKVEYKINNNLEIIRLNIPKEKKSPIIRALRYLWMNILFVFKSNKYDADAIFVQSTPPTQGAMAALIKKHKKIPFIYNLQDVFPDSMVGAGLTTEKSLLFKIGRLIENYTYKNADCIIVISNDIKNNIIKKGVSENKIIVIPNWIDSNLVHPISRQENYLFEKYKISREKFIVVYAGNLGYAQNIEVIIEAAKKLQDNELIQFVVFGKGAQEEEYKKQADGLRNLVFLPIQPYSEVSYVYSLGDASIVPCKRGFGGSAMPSKTWSIMASGTPVLASFDSDTDLEKLIKKEEFGLFSLSEDADGLIKNILTLFNNPNLKKQMGENARKYVQSNLSRKKCTYQYIEAVKRICAEERAKR